MKQSRWNGTDRVCGASKHPHKSLVTSYQVQVIRGHDVKKKKYKLSGLGGVIHTLRSVFRQEHRNDPRTLLERPKVGKMKNWENAEIPINSVKRKLFDT